MRARAGAALAALLLSASASAATVKGKLMPGLLVELKTADGWTLKAKHSPAKEGRKTFLLLHGTGGRKEDWYYMARALSGWGYGYLAVDFRGHGESSLSPAGTPASWHKFRVTKTENEFANMSRDIDAAAAFLLQSGVPEDQLGVIGADVGSSLGLKYAAVHPKVPMLIMLSPGLHYQEILTVNAIRAYKNRPILMIYAEADKYSSKETPLLQGFAKMTTGEANVTVLTVPQEHGCKMLRKQRDLVVKIIDWIASPVKVLDVGASTPAAPGEISTAVLAAPPAEDPGDEDAGE
jgi:dienelactone hydrolase